MIKLWILNHYAVTPGMPGGTRHYDFAKELAKRGYDVSIFASSFNYIKHKELKLNAGQAWKAENIDGIKFIWIKTFPYCRNDWRRAINMLSYMSRAYWAGRKIKNIGKPDIIIGSSVHLLAGISAYWLAKYHKAKFIMEIRDLWPQTLIDMKKIKQNGLLTRVLQITEKFLYRKAKKIIVLLYLAGEYIASLGIARDKIAWIPNGVNLVYPKKTTEREDGEYFKLLYVGAHGVANDLYSVLDAAKIIQERGIQNIKFIFVGDGIEKEKLIEYKHQLRIGNIEFLPAVPKEVIANTLSKADILLFNLKDINVFKYGISSNKLFDYMLAAKPVIFSAKAGNNPIKESGCGVSIAPERPDLLADAVIQFYRMPKAEREKMGLRGRDYLERYHNIQLLADKFDRVIAEINR